MEELRLAGQTGELDTGRRQHGRPGPGQHSDWGRLVTLIDEPVAEAPIEAPSAPPMSRAGWSSAGSPAPTTR